MDDEEQCTHHWNEGESGREGHEHVCRRIGEHRTHVCPCMAIDTTSRPADAA